MNDLNDVVIDQVCSLINDQKLIIFAGAGISHDAGFRLLDELLLALIDEYEVSLPYSVIRKERDIEYLRAQARKKEIFIAEQIYKADSRLYYNVLRDSFKKDPKGKLEIHRLLLDLNCNIITTNYDTCFEKIRNEYSNMHERTKTFTSNSTSPKSDVYSRMYERTPFKIKIFPRITKGELISEINNSNKLIVKLHGSADDVKNIIFKPSDYGEHYQNSSELSNIINWLFETFSFLFIGYSLDDPVLAEITRKRNIFCNVNSETNSWYTFFKYEDHIDMPFEIDRLNTEMDMKPIFFKVKNKNGKKDYSEIKRILKEIFKRINQGDINET